MRTQALARVTAGGRDYRALLKSAGKLNIIRAAQGSLQSVASGIRRYVEFRAAL